MIEDHVEKARREAELEAAAAAVAVEAGRKAPAGRPGEGYGSANSSSYPCFSIVSVSYHFIFM